MKKQVKCYKCGALLTSMPGNPRLGPGYAFNCSCGAVILEVYRAPHYLFYELLVYASAHVAEKEMRSAVVEAHTALDVFARRWAQDALQSLNTPDPVADYILKGARTGRLIRMVKTLHPNNGFTAPPDEVFDLRNDVIHKGKVPTEKEAEDAIRAVRDWIMDMMKKTEPVFKLTPDK